MATWPYLRLRDVLVRAHRHNMWVTREDLARRYLSGSGIEIGAMDKPLRVPPGVRVIHVDRKDRATLVRDEGPLLAALEIDVRRVPRVDVVDDAERLSGFADKSLDFVIANHVVEHLEDPIRALENMVRVLRPGGVVFLTLPDARRTFDACRARTTVEHVLQDHRKGPGISRRRHYEEWARELEGIGDHAVAARVAEYERDDARHHFHVWALEDFLALLRAIDLPADLVEARACAIEFAVILRRSETA